MHVYLRTKFQVSSLIKTSFRRGEDTFTSPLKKIMTKFVGIIAKTYRLLIDDGSEEKANLNLKVGKTV